MINSVLLYVVRIAKNVPHRQNCERESCNGNSLANIDLTLPKQASDHVNRLGGRSNEMPAIVRSLRRGSVEQPSCRSMLGVIQDLRLNQECTTARINSGGSPCPQKQGKASNKSRIGTDGVVSHLFRIALKAEEG